MSPPRGHPPAGQSGKARHHPVLARSKNSVSTRSARCPSTPCSRPIPAIPARRWRWRRWSTRCGRSFLRFDPEDPIWPNRDRFVLSTGHASMLLYSMLHLTGVKAVNAKYERLGEPSVTLDDIKRFRQLDSKCPGHPEYRLTSGVETTTGPLGQGCAHQRRHGDRGEAGWRSTSTGPDFAMFDYDVYALCGDGDMMEGVGERGGLARRPPDARQSVLDLRQQPHHDRGPHRSRLQRGCRRALPRLWLERAAGRRRQRRGTARRERSRISGAPTIGRP